MINLTKNETQLARTVQRARERSIIIPTFEQQKNPTLIPQKIAAGLKDTGLWDRIRTRLAYRIMNQVDSAVIVHHMGKNRNNQL